MTVNQRSRSAEVRAKLGHPVIDADGHHLEMGPVFLDYLRRIGGASIADRYLAIDGGGELWMRATKWDKTLPRHGWWNFPTKNTLDRATAHLPKLFYERMDEIGFDYSVVYPTTALAFGGYEDPEMRIACCRAYNAYVADIYRDFADRITPVAVVSVDTPAEACQEAEHAVKALGLKAIMISGGGSFPRRRIAGGEQAKVYGQSFYWDMLALDSPYDYDPFWAKCVELKVAVASHAGAKDWATRRSPLNHVYNHIGHFGAAGEAFCKALFLGGVTRRFPTLKFAFLEGGVAWACSLYNGLLGHWQKRNVGYLLENLDPSKLDRDEMLRLIARYGGAETASKLEEFREIFSRQLPVPEDLDEFAACRIERAEDVRDLFVPNFYFGCEADDPTNACAFNTRMNPFGARLQAVFGSDVGHWDVPDMKGVLAEAYELVEHEVLTQQDFRNMMFTHPVSLYAGMNPDFFKGTRIQAEVANALGQGKPNGR